MTDTYSPNYGEPNEWPDVDSNGNIIYPITFGHNAPTDGPSRTPLKDLNGDTILNDRAPLVTGEDGLRAVEIAVAAEKSYQTAAPRAVGSPA